MSETKYTSKTFIVDYLARVEGEGSLHLRIRNDKIVDAKFKIFEPPRFFEAFLQGRKYFEAPDITARICGICPIAYQMSAVHAMENAFGIDVTGQLRALRRLIYCGEWIESHLLHIYMLHAPDFLGYQDAIQLAKDAPEVVQRGLQLKKIGNQIVILMAGREIHPINVCVGGFYSVPTKKELKTLVEPLKWALDAAYETVKWTAGFEFPDYEDDYIFVSLHHPEEYPFNEGKLISTTGLDIAIPDYEQYFQEEQVPHSTALHSVLKEEGNYFVGPLARFNLNYEQLTPIARQAADEVQFKPICFNPFKSIIARSIETVFACEQALKIIDEYEMPSDPVVKIEPKTGTGYGCTEAPRGSLYHRYRVDQNGVIQNAKIVPPTSQNQKTIERDLWRYAEKYFELPQDQFIWQCEQAIRNYDPCISCSTHFLKLHVEKEL